MAKTEIYYTDPKHPKYGTSEVIEHPDVPDVILKPQEPTKAELLAKVEELLTAVQALK